MSIVIEYGTINMIKPFLLLNLDIVCCWKLRYYIYVKLNCIIIILCKFAA